jgi:hypothetical protein
VTGKKRTGDKRNDRRRGEGGSCYTKQNEGKRRGPNVFFNNQIPIIPPTISLSKLLVPILFFLYNFFSWTGVNFLDKGILGFLWHEVLLYYTVYIKIR